MKKTVIFLVKVFLIITLSFVSFYFVYKSITKNNLENKLIALEKNWSELLKLQDKKKMNF